MRKVLKKSVKYTFIVIFVTLLFFSFYIMFIFLFSPVKFNPKMLNEKNLYVQIFDNEKRPLKHTFINNEYVNISQIPEITKKCFISIEDKDFYKHKGLNYKRIIGATIKNFTSFSFKEGASTISQQLIKNTMLTNEKTLKRKINEIKLTKKLEKKYSKDKILELYLNVIYFGDNCYGIQNASEHYFSKPVSKLNLEESAILAGIIKSPNRYHPIKNYEKCLKRRNIVLSELKKDKIITNEEYEITKSNKTELNISANVSEMNSYTKSAIKEAEEILKLPEKQIAIGKYRIYTYMDKEKQEAIENSINYELPENVQMISMDSKSAHVNAYVEKSTMPLINVKRQPASAIKPLLVYAPAINENIITPRTEILDENISINGYEPKNINSKEYGYVSVKKALSNSLNIPAVKILSYIGIDKAKNYLENQNIIFDEKDDNLALALGGMTYGVTLKDLTNCYQTLANEGKYVNSKFIDYILDNNGKVIYKNESSEKRIFRDDTSYLVTDILNDCSKNGTSKRLSDLPFYVASKTGTSSISKNNIDAYNISYTSKDVVGCWIGNIDNSPIKIVGGGTPTAFVKNYLNAIYSNIKPKDFTIPSSVVELDIDLIALKNDHILYKANNYLPDRFKEKAYFSRFNEPKNNFNNNLILTPVTIEAKVNGNIADIFFNSNAYYSYMLYKIEDGKEIFIDEISNTLEKIHFKQELTSGKIHSFAVKTKAKNYITGEEIISELSNIVDLYIK